MSFQPRTKCNAPECTETSSLFKVRLCEDHILPYFIANPEHTMQLLRRMCDRKISMSEHHHIRASPQDVEGSLYFSPLREIQGRFQLLIAFDAKEPRPPSGWALLHFDMNSLGVQTREAVKKSDEKDMQESQYEHLVNLPI